MISKHIFRKHTDTEKALTKKISIIKNKETMNFNISQVLLNSLFFYISLLEHLFREARKSQPATSYRGISVIEKKSKVS